jgi:hypothetical protein
MLIIGLVALVAVAALLLAWHHWWSKYNRRQSLEVVRWIERALVGQGHAITLRRLGASRFRVGLRLACGGFRDPYLRLELPPRQWPWRWAMARLRREEATITFQADLDSPPAFNLEVHNQRWIGRTTRRGEPLSDWQLERGTPFILTTRRDWHKEIASLLSSLLATRDLDFQRVQFRRQSPHFSATLSLDALSPAAEAPDQAFQLLRELAANASAVQ